MKPPIDWDHVYLLGWYDQAGRSYLTSWDGPSDYVHVVVKTAQSPPMWSAPVPPGAELAAMPEHLTTLTDRVQYATSIGGVYAFGWLMNLGETIDRTRRGRVV